LLDGGIFPHQGSFERELAFKLEDSRGPKQ
jgi:hypothetical protein